MTLDYEVPDDFFGDWVRVKCFGGQNRIPLLKRFILMGCLF